MADRNDVEARVVALIAKELEVSEEEVTADASFRVDLGANSLDTVQLVMAFEEEFDLDISDDDAEKLETVGQTIEYLIGRL
ncbi:MAG: acyl carrier protein [Candidatus Schekmanbacteria bacterium]|nr:acyl carrier protein [Candidatus Schekmanbacteria bacterium]